MLIPKIAKKKIPKTSYVDVVYTCVDNNRATQCPKCHNAIIVKTSYGVWKCPGCGHTKGEDKSEKFISQKPSAIDLLEKRVFIGEIDAIPELIDLLGSESIEERHRIKALLVRARQYSSPTLVKIYLERIHSRKEISTRISILEILRLNCQREEILLLIAAINQIPSLKEKVAVLDVLVHLNDPDLINPLIPLYPHSTLQFKNKIIDVLIQIGNFNAINPLIEFLKTAKSEKEKAILIHGLEEIADSHLILPIIDLLPNSEVSTRVEIFKALGRLQCSDAVHCLIEFFERSSSTKEKIAIIQAISQMDDTCICDFLTTNIDYPNIQTQEAIVNALGCAGNSDAVIPLQTIFNNTQSERIRDAAAFSLASIGDVKATPEILKYLQTIKEPQKNHILKILVKEKGFISHLKSNVKYGDINSINWMLELILAEPSNFRNFFQDDIQNSPICLYHFFKKLSDPKRKITLEILSIIGELGDSRGCEILKIYIKSCPLSEKNAVVKILGKIDDRKSVSILIDLMNDSAITSKEIIDTLSKMTDKSAKDFIQKLVISPTKKNNAVRDSDANKEMICLTVNSIRKTPKVKNKKKKPAVNKPSSSSERIITKNIRLQQFELDLSSPYPLVRIGAMKQLIQYNTKEAKKILRRFKV